MATDPNVWQKESLLATSTVRLFGRPMSDLFLADDRDSIYGVKQAADQTQESPRAISENRFLAEQLAESDAIFARIYFYVYQGQRVPLVRPTVFMVHGDGLPISGDGVKKTAGLLGVGQSCDDFAPDLRMWVYDRADFTLRLDIQSGSFTELLMGYEEGGSGISATSMQGGDAEGPAIGSEPARRRRWRPA